LTKTSADLVNALFQTGAALGSWLNYFVLKKDRYVRGTYWPLYLVFVGWGWWNVFYFSFLGQWLSFFTNILTLVGNMAWLVLALRLLIK
jgi:hypothetical protein